MLDVDRLATVMLEGAQALIAHEIAPLRQANDALRAENAALLERVKDLEGVTVILRDRSADVAAVRSIAQEMLAQAVLAEPEGLDDRIKAAAADAVAALPVPRDGKDADPADLAPLEEAVAALAKRLDEMPAPRDGRDADPEVIKAMVAEAISTIPTPQDGNDADPEMVRAMVEDAIKAIPLPKDGKDADPAIVRAMVDEAVRALPPAKDGKDAAPAEMQAVKEAIAELRGWKDAIRIPDAIHGKDGRSVVSARVNDDGELVLKYSDGDTDNLGRITGKDGKDAFEIGALSIEYDGERTIEIGWPSGEKHALHLPIPIYRGVWKEAEYKRGDQVTWGGSVFTAMTDTTSKPETDKSWLLSTKRGRDGKEVVRAEPRTAPVKLEGGNAG